MMTLLILYLSLRFCACLDALNKPGSCGIVFRMFGFALVPSNVAVAL